MFFCNGSDQDQLKGKTKHTGALCFICVANACHCYASTEHMCRIFCENTLVYGSSRRTAYELNLCCLHIPFPVISLWSKIKAQNAPLQASKIQIMISWHGRHRKSTDFLMIFYSTHLIQQSIVLADTMARIRCDHSFDYFHHNMSDRVIIIVWSRRMLPSTLKKQAMKHVLPCRNLFFFN